MGSDTVDVVIIGAGPSGLIAASWMAKCGIKTRIVEQRPYKLRVGGADGIHPRSMEMLESFGYDVEISRLWEPVSDWAYWNRGSDGELKRMFRLEYPEPLDYPAPIRARWAPGTLQQGVIEKIFKDHLREDGIEVEYETSPSSLIINEQELHDPDAYPVTVTLTRQHKQPNGTSEVQDSEEDEVVRAKYVIGSDGARSWTRQQLGVGLEGHKTKSIWGVMDLEVETNFPDIRTASTVKSHVGGGFFFLRRERGMLRFYVQLNKDREDEEFTTPISEETIIGKLKEMLQPYRLNVKRCEWWSHYTVAHYVSTDMVRNNRVFLVGDAVHQHSPLIGLGMNVSMQDSYNLGWKLAGVLRKQMIPEILSTYQVERRPVAQDLIELDQFHLESFNTDEESKPQWMVEKEMSLEPHLLGFAVDYKDSPLTVLSSNAASVDFNPTTSEGGDEDGPTGRKTRNKSDILVPGKRFPQLTCSNHASAKLTSLQSLMKARNGWFHVVVFAGDLSRNEQLKRCNALGAGLEELRAALSSTRGGRAGGLSVLMVHRTPKRSDMELTDLADIFFPLLDGMPQDYERVFCSLDTEYHDLGLPEEGGIVAVRPDQYVGYCRYGLDISGLRDYFSGIYVAIE